MFFVALAQDLFLSLPKPWITHSHCEIYKEKCVPLFT